MLPLTSSTSYVNSTFALLSQASKKITSYLPTSDSVKEAFGAIAARFQTPASLQRKVVISQSVDEQPIPKDLPKLFYCKGIVERTSENKYKITQFILGQKKELLFDNKKALNQYLGEVSPNWEIHDNDLGTVVYKHWDGLIEDFEDFNQKQLFYYILAKETGGVFKLIDQGNNKPVFVLDQSGYFSVNIQEFSQESEFKEALNKKVRRTNTNRKCLAIAVGAAVVGAAVIGAGAYIYRNRINNRDSNSLEPFPLKNGKDAAPSPLGRNLLALGTTGINGTYPTIQPKVGEYFYQEYLYPTVSGIPTTTIESALRYIMGEYYSIPNGLEVVNLPNFFVDSIDIGPVNVMVIDNNIFITTTIANQSRFGGFKFSSPPNSILSLTSAQCLIPKDYDRLEIINNKIYGIKWGDPRMDVFDHLDGSAPVYKNSIQIDSGFANLVLNYDVANDYDIDNNFNPTYYYVNYKFYFLYNNSDLNIQDGSGSPGIRIPFPPISNVTTFYHYGHIDKSWTLYLDGPSDDPLYPTFESSYYIDSSYIYIPVTVTKPTGNELILWILNAYNQTNPTTAGVVNFNLQRTDLDLFKMDKTQIVLGSKNNNFQVSIDIKNKTNPVMKNWAEMIPFQIIDAALKDNFFYVGTPNSVNVYYLDDQTHAPSIFPYLIQQFPVTDSITKIMVDDNYCYVGTNQGLKYFKTQGGRFAIKGTPGLSGEDLVKIRSRHFLYNLTTEATIQINVQKSIIDVLIPIDDQVAYVGNNFNFVVPTFTFYESNPRYLILVRAPSGNNIAGYGSQQFGGLTVTNSQIFGVPTNGIEEGTYTVEVEVENNKGGYGSTTFKLTILYPPMLKKGIPNQLAKNGVPFSYSIDKNTFAGKGNHTIGYDIEELPSWLVFNKSALSLSGTPTQQDVGSVPITLKAMSSNGANMTTNFEIKVVSTSALVVLNEIPSQAADVGSIYTLQVPENTIVDPEGIEKLAYSASLKGGDPLPSWLHFDPVNRRFSGIPARATTDYVDLYTLEILLTAKAKKSVGQTTFYLRVSGSSSSKIAVSVLSTLASLAGAALAAYKKRSLVLNRNFKRLNPLPRQEFTVIGQPFHYQLRTPIDQVYKVHAFYNDKPLSGGRLLPLGIEYNTDTNAIESSQIPNLKNQRKFKIQVIASDDIIKEEFSLEVEPQRDDEKQSEGNSKDINEINVELGAMRLQGQKDTP